MIETKENTWTTYDGITNNVCQLDDDHLCNIYWFNKVFHNTTVEFINDEIIERFGSLDNCLRWEPLPIPGEVKAIKEICDVYITGGIYINGKCIGSLSHIKGWKEL